MLKMTADMSAPMIAGDARLLTVAAMRRADAAAIGAGTPGVELMERAGAAVARAAGRMAPTGARILVLCGSGDNGGDGFVAARILAEQGRTVALGLLGDRAALKGDAALAARRWPGPVEPAETIALAGVGLIVDALFGAGLARDLEGAARAAATRVNVFGAPVLAVDLPSGVDGDTGAIRGVAIRSTRTVTFIRRKAGHLLLPGRDLAGEIEVADIGAAMLADDPDGWLFANQPGLWRDFLPRYASDGHKYERGHLLVVAGGIEGVGAPRLSARAGLRVGAGLATIAAPADALAAHAARGPDALMLRRTDSAGDLRRLVGDRRLSAIAIGPALGLDRDARRKVDVALASDAACVLDADALTLLAGDLGAIRRAARRKPIVLTPHEGEFARLFGEERERGGVSPTASKLERARTAAAASEAAVILKGADTVIAAPDGRAAINENAPPWLATAGSGDVLTGLVAGLLAPSTPAWEAACAAVWLHGEAGRRAGRGLIADDLPEQAARTLAKLTKDQEEASSPGV